MEAYKSANPEANIIRLGIGDVTKPLPAAVIAGLHTAVDEMADEMLEFIIDVASGNIKTKAAILNQNDFIPWKRGVSL